MKALLDTQAALYFWVEPERLSDSARKVIEDRNNRLYFSQASTWEVVIKYSLGKLPLPEQPGAYLPTRIRRTDFEYEPISDRALFGMLDLPDVHRDPFDRLLISTARILRVPVITGDPVFRDYPVKVIW